MDRGNAKEEMPHAWIQMTKHTKKKHGIAQTVNVAVTNT
jgi:hypothetical protein